MNNRVRMIEKARRMCSKKAKIHVFLNIDLTAFSEAVSRVREAIVKFAESVRMSANSAKEVEIE